MHWEASQGERMQGRELSRPTETWSVGDQTVVPQQVELASSLEAVLAVETPEWRHQEGEQRGGSAGLQLSRVLRPAGGAGGGGGAGGARAFLRV